MRAIITYKDGAKEEIKNLTEVHYCYKSLVRKKQIAFESDIDSTGFTRFVSGIKEIEIFDK